jgi:hypothetical protein
MISGYRDADKPVILDLIDRSGAVEQFLRL